MSLYVTEYHIRITFFINKVIIIMASIFRD